MVKRVGSSRRKTRHLYKVAKKAKGKIPVSEFVKKLNTGELVQLIAHPSILKGIYFRRFHGRAGTIVGMQGNCYKVQITDGGKEKTLIVSPLHLRKVASQVIKATPAASATA